MPVDRSHIRVKAMLVATHSDGARHLVSQHDATVENPLGFHRLIGGGVELGETHEQAILREVREELQADVVDLTFLGVVESIFGYDGELGHEIVALYAGRLHPEPALEGGTLTESDGSIVPILWRPFRDDDVSAPLYPSAANGWIRDIAARAATPGA
ncbi:NADH pyrophosphatase [Microbacterium oxydans]|uniref:NADH pyrophosphatase n=2 Tax=Microbacterium oxydans TaxID=82380 RepID=A0A0F0KCT4_9MICO|nr:NADH pyrophosphatase [Microbacterium oxydans]